jgi:hypothetical protein
MATELKHTSGPWAIFDHHDATRINIRGPNEEFVADCADGFYSEEADEWVMAQESYPNALLIAAAPDLLSELENSASALEEAAKLLFAKGLQGCASIMAANSDRARHAIAKATGAA